jgi:hypothetical protein
MHGAPTRRPPVWHGTHQEAADLLATVLRHCTCIVDEHAGCVTLCPPHMMVYTDQRAMDGLLFARRMYARLRAEEFAVVGNAPVV